MHPPTHKLQHFFFEVHSKLAVSPDDVTQSHDVSESDIEIQPLCKGPLGAIVSKALKIKEKKKKTAFVDQAKIYLSSASFFLTTANLITLLFLCIYHLEACCSQPRGNIKMSGPIVLEKSILPEYIQPFLQSSKLVARATCHNEFHKSIVRYVEMYYLLLCFTSPFWSALLDGPCSTTVIWEKEKNVSLSILFVSWMILWLPTLP